ncbi:hypothetical protein RB195_019567 [Necator americanus]|uniref:Uncharacterized protein n=1 Tax=Necator americanus TaxID=51031 RepID=A0ABR1CEU6_NECAM
MHGPHHGGPAFMIARASQPEKPTLADVEKWDAHVLLAVAKQKLRNEKGSKHTYVGHSRTHLLVFSLMLMQLMMAVVGGGADSL